MNRKEREEYARNAYPTYESLLTAYLNMEEKFEESEKLNGIDGATGLLNKTAIIDNIERLFADYRRTETPVTVAFIDLDDFKTLNGTYGHIAVDHLVAKIADRLKHSIRETDVIGRYGGDEFCIAFPHTNYEQAREAIGKLEVAMEKPFEMPGEGNIVVQISTGLAVSSEVNIKTQKGVDVIELANSRMYEIKNAKK